MAIPSARTVTPSNPARTTPPSALDVTAPPPAASAPVADPVNTSSRDYATPLLGLLAAIGLGSAGIVMLRRRRTIPDDAVYEEPAYEPVAEPAPVQASDWNTPVVTPVAPEATGMLVPPNATHIDEEPIAAEAQPEPASIPEPAYGAAAAAMPARDDEFDEPRAADAVPTGDARQQMLDEMVAAEPDEANPFRSPVARRRRARLILQKREHDQEEAARSFDWRSYSAERSEEAVAPTREHEITQA